MWCWYHCIGIIYCFLVQTLQFSGCGYGGGTTILVLCFGIESRLHMTNTMVVVVLVVPLYWYCSRASDDIYYCCGCGGGTTVLVLFIGIVSNLYKFNWGSYGGGTTVLVLRIVIYSRLCIVNSVVVVPPYWYYVLVLSRDFT